MSQSDWTAYERSSSVGPASKHFIVGRFQSRKVPASRFSKAQYTGDTTHENKLMSRAAAVSFCPSNHSFFAIFAPSLESFTFENMRSSANLSILDFVLLPFFLALIYAIAYKIRNGKYSYKHPWRKYFIPALTVKIFGAIFIGLIYSYYY